MVSVESLDPGHYELAAAWLSEPETNRWLGSEWRGRQVDPKLLSLILMKPANRMWLAFRDGLPCGLVAVGDMDKTDGSGVLWYLLGDRERGGKGLMTEAVGRVCRLAFEDLGLRSLQASIMEPNIPSRRVLEKCGFREVGILRQGLTLDGEPVDRILYDLIASDLG